MADTRKIYIRRIENNELIETIETSMVGHNLRKLLIGLFRKVDLDRFIIDDSEVAALLPKD